MKHINFQVLVVIETIKNREKQYYINQFMWLSEKGEGVGNV
jgi:hypothetical protein